MLSMKLRGESFTFYCSSIKRRSHYEHCPSYQSSLHSTVVLLKANNYCLDRNFHETLHSTVVLLKVLVQQSIQQKRVSLHSTVVLLKVRFFLFALYIINAFTFYCSSIKSVPCSLILPISKALYILL